MVDPAGIVNFRQYSAEATEYDATRMMNQDVAFVSCLWCNPFDFE